MIDPVRDNIYNIILSIFLGIILIIAVEFILDSPRTVTLLSDRTEGFANKCFSDKESKCLSRTSHISHASHTS